MKIRPELIEAAGFNPTKKTYQISVLDICKQIDNEEITLPLYQRDVSWTLKQSVELLNYQLLGKAPVAPISINEINNTEKEYVVQVSFIDREIVNIIKNRHLSIADGQQRLTTNYKAYKNSVEFRNVVLDLLKGKFIIVEGEIKNYQIPVGTLLNENDSVFYDYVNRNSTLRKPEVMSVIFQIRNKLRDYNYTINLAEDLSEEEQIEWFEVLNNAGSRVTRIQMRFSKLKTKGIDIYSQYTNLFQQKIEECGLDLFTIKQTEVSIPIAALNPSYEVIMEKDHSPNYTPIPSDTRENQLCSLTEDQLKSCFKLTLDALDTALNFITSNKLTKPSRIDYITYLTGLFVFYDINKLTEFQYDEIIKWYYDINFTNKSNSERRTIFSKLLSIPTTNDFSEQIAIMHNN